jgi:hypothetical protein
MCQNEPTHSVPNLTVSTSEHVLLTKLMVAEEKCDALASTAKDTCMAEAKVKFGKL